MNRWRRRIFSSLLLTISSIFISYADDSQFFFRLSSFSLVGFFTPTNPVRLSLDKQINKCVCTHSSREILVRQKKKKKKKKRYRCRQIPIDPSERSLLRGATLIALYKAIRKYILLLLLCTIARLDQPIQIYIYMLPYLSYTILIPMWKRWSHVDLDVCVSSETHHQQTFNLPESDVYHTFTQREKGKEESILICYSTIFFFLVGGCIVSLLS